MRDAPGLAHRRASRGESDSFRAYILACRVHLHTALTGQNVDDNLIVGNYIAGNGADTADAATPGPTGINVFGVAPIVGTVIADNVIKDEQVDIAVNTLPPAVVDV